MALRDPGALPARQRVLVLPSSVFIQNGEESNLDLGIADGRVVVEVYCVMTVNQLSRGYTSQKGESKIYWCHHL